MTDNVNAEENVIQATAETAQAEENIAAAGLGKFKSVDALMNAYLSLEAEFTRRSQRLRERSYTHLTPPAERVGGVDGGGGVV